MAQGQDPASVRIEFESGPPTALDALLGESSKEPGQQPEGSRWVLLGVVLLAALVLGFLWLIRPGPDEAADGSLRGPTTTTATPTTTATVDSTSSAPTTRPSSVDGVQIIPLGPPDEETDVIDATGLAAPAVEVLEGGGGYLALGQSSGAATGPVLYGSPSGSSWVRLVRGLGSEILSQPTILEDVQFSYHALGVVDSGLVVSVLERFSDRESGETTRINVKRLITDDGTTWIIDPDFTVLEVEGLAALPTFNGPDSTTVAVLPDGRENALVGEMLRAWATDPELTSGCFVSAIPGIGVGGVESTFRLQPCDFGPMVTVRPEQLVDPDRVEALFICLQQLSSRSAPQIDVYTQRRGDPAPTSFTVGTTASTPVPVGSSERSVTLVPGSSFDSAPGCVGFADAAQEVPGVVDPGMAVLGPGSDVTTISSDGILSTLPLFLEQPQIAASNDKVVVPLAGAVYSVDLESAEWVVEARASSTIESTHVAPNGRQIFTFQGSTLYFADVGEPWQSIGLDRALQRPTILHADDERVFFNQGFDTLMIELPAG